MRVFHALVGLDHYPEFIEVVTVV